MRSGSFQFYRLDEFFMSAKQFVEATVAMSTPAPLLVEDALALVDDVLPQRFVLGAELFGHLLQVFECQR